MIFFTFSHELPMVSTARQGLDRHEAYCPKAFAVSGHACATVQVTVPHAHVRTPCGISWRFTGDNSNGYGSIPINTIFSGMNIHLPAILMFTRGTRF